MNSAAWRNNFRFWVPGTVVFVLMSVLLSVFVLRFSDAAAVAQARLTRRAEELDSVRARRLQAEEAVERIRSSEAGLAEFYGGRLSSESRSLTAIIGEIKDLAARAGIPPGALAYDRERLEGQDVARRSIRFAVNGSYQQLRQLINFFELSDSFLILDEIGLSSNDVEGPLRINLQLSTLFTVGSQDGSEPAANLES